MSKRPRVSQQATPLTANPFAELLSRASTAPAAPSPTAESSPAEAPPSGSARSPLAESGRLVVRREKKGRGGKTVTRVEGLPVEGLPALLRRLKREVGCGGRLEGADLVAGTGDHERVAAWLRAAGASRVTLGN